MDLGDGQAHRWLGCILCALPHGAWPQGWLASKGEGLTRILGQAMSAGLDLFYPPECQMCRLNRATKDQSYICHHCRNDLKHLQWIESGYCRKCGAPFEGEFTIEFDCSNCAGEEYHF